MKIRLKYSRSGLKFTSTEEGFRGTAYQDSSGIWTLGFGHIKNVKEGDTCTYNQALGWLIIDVSDAENAVNTYVTIQLNQNEFDALVDFVFNLGIGNFLSSTLLKLLNKGDFKGAANEFQRWDHCDGKVLTDLFNRRTEEEVIFETPVTTTIPPSIPPTAQIKGTTMTSFNVEEQSSPPKSTRLPTLTNHTPVSVGIIVGMLLHTILAILKQHGQDYTAQEPQILICVTGIAGYFTKLNKGNQND